MNNHGKHTFVNQIVCMIEDLDKWSQDESVSKEDVINGTKTRLLWCMRAGLVHPFTTFYSLEASTVVAALEEEEEEDITVASSSLLEEEDD
jgi:hypothetical protein